MNRNVHSWIFLVICLLSTIAAHASNTTPAPITDPAQISTHYHQVLQRPEFEAPADTDIDTRFKDWLSQWFIHLGTKLSQFQFTPQMHSVSLLLMALLLVLTLTGLLYIVFRFSRRRGIRDEALPIQIPGQKVFHPPEFYDEEIRKAIGARDWHTAWLLTWKQFLSRLENRNLVEADRTRTNREYLAQLRQQAIPSTVFTQLARMVDAYDRFIYGCKPIGEPDWNLFHQQIDEAVLLLHLNEKNSRLTGKQGTA